MLEPADDVVTFVRCLTIHFTSILLLLDTLCQITLLEQRILYLKETHQSLHAFRG